MQSQTFKHVFDALADTLAEEANLKPRNEPMMAIRAQVDSWSMPQQAAAQRLGLTCARLNDLLRGKLSLDALVNLAIAAGLVLAIWAAQSA